MIVNEINFYIGYENVVKNENKVFDEKISLKEDCVGIGFLTAEKFDEVFKPEDMAYPQGR